MIICDKQNQQARDLPNTSKYKGMFSGKQPPNMARQTFSHPVFSLLGQLQFDSNKKGWHRTSISCKARQKYADSILFTRGLKIQGDSSSTECSDSPLEVQRLCRLCRIRMALGGGPKSCAVHLPHQRLKHG